MTIPVPHETWIARLDEVKTKLGLSSDRQLAAYLECTHQYIGNIRRGLPISPLTRLKLLDALGQELDRNALAEVLPDDAGLFLSQIEHQKKDDQI